MPAVAKAEKSVAAGFTMPQPKSGIVVWHYADGSGDPATAIVTKVTRDSIDVVVFAIGGGLMTRTGVRHQTDPRLKTMTEPNPGGVFELTPFELMVEKLF